MSTKSPESIPGQSEFEFNPDEVKNDGFTPWDGRSPRQKLRDITRGEMGAHVEISEYDKALLETVYHLAQASKLEGVLLAMETPHRDEFKKRYGKNLPNLITNVERAKFAHEVDARHEIKGAFGYQQMVDLHSPIVASEFFAHVYDNFQDKHGNSEGNFNRTKLKKKVAKNIGISAVSNHEDSQSSHQARNISRSFRSDGHI